jgi:hypothetical protein
MECVTSVFISAVIFIELVVTSKEDQFVVTALYLAAIMLSTICISVWIAMFQAANIAKAKQALASCFEESTVEMDDDKTIAQDDMKYYCWKKSRLTIRWSRLTSLLSTPAWMPPTCCLQEINCLACLERNG